VPKTASLDERSLADLGLAANLIERLHRRRNTGTPSPSMTISTGNNILCFSGSPHSVRADSSLGLGWA
jgi:hypothetical protein